LHIDRGLCDNNVMLRLDLTLPTAAENVALDEALLDWAEEAEVTAGDAPRREVLRIWESPAPLVVAGRSTRIEQEVNVAECDRLVIPIIRRSSGGAAIVAGPGCLMYAVVLSLKSRPDLRDITRAHRFVLGRLADALNSFGYSVSCAGTSDLVIADFGLQIADCASGIDKSATRNPQSGIDENRKFSGNSLRVKRTHFLYHGSLLYNFDLSLIASCLRMPPRQPVYRAARPHLDFLANLTIGRPQLVNAIDAAFPTTGEVTHAPLARAEELVATRFGRNSWNREFA
jgi:lipoate-protein ligase A